MNDRNQQYSDENRLWRQFAVQDQAQPILSDLDPNLLAAYLDGKADSAQVQQIEALMASNPALLEETIELRQLQDAGSALACQALLDRAKALAPPPRSAALTPGRTPWWQRLQWAAAAAAIFVACLGGYNLGRFTFRAQGLAEALVAADISRDVEAIVTEPTLAIIVWPNGQNGATP